MYVNKADSTTIAANEFKAKLTSNNATADLKILTTGELLSVTGKITPQEKRITTTKIKDKSGLYIYGMLPLNKTVSPEVGALYQLRNKMFISGGVQYNDLTKSIDFKVGIGIKIF